MRIRFVLCHPAHGLIAEEREIFLASALCKIGHDAAFFAISNRNLRESRRYPEFACPVEMFPPDGRIESPHRATSAALLQALREDEPDIVLVKGIDYRQATAVFETFSPDRLGVIIGGRSSHPLLDAARVIYFESRRQKENYTGPALTTVLPKYIKWEDLGDVADTEKRFDVINVGNFNEPRKSQEFLFPLAYRHKVALVGGGPRLQAFKSIAQGNPNISFAGFLDRKALFSWLKASYLMVHTSTSDGYPRAVAESLAAGVPVIGVTGVLDGITPDPLIRCTGVEDLTATAAARLRAREELLQLGKRAHEYMLNTSGYDSLRDAFLELLRR